MRWGLGIFGPLQARCARENYLCKCKSNAFPARQCNETNRPMDIETISPTISLFAFAHRASFLSRCFCAARALLRLRPRLRFGRFQNGALVHLMHEQPRDVADRFCGPSTGACAACDGTPSELVRPRVCWRYPDLKPLAAPCQAPH